MSVKRIQRRRTKGWRMPDNTVYVGRGSKWGNPYALGETQIRMPALDGKDWELEGRLYKTSGQENAFCHGDGTITWHQVENATREQCVELFREYITGEPYRKPYRYASQVEAVREALAGKNLACWCPLDQPCHADVLLELANQEGS